MLTPLHLSPSFGFGDRLGLATRGHIEALRHSTFDLRPIFAQQSVRENARVGRTPQQVMDNAKRAVESAKWDKPWGADADHLKSLDDLPSFVDAGYNFFTIDPSEHVDNSADTDPLSVLQKKVADADWEKLSALYLSGNSNEPWAQVDAENLLRAQVKYGRAIQHAASMFNRLSQMKDDFDFDFEVSVDETDSPTTPLEHFFIASELTRLGVKFTSLAPRFIGDFEKGVDYIGDLNALDVELAKHAAVTAHFGTYKLSLHSGSDKFSVYPLIAKHWGERIHVKTAGTSYLEALRVLAKHEPNLFLKIYSLGRERYETDRRTYHVSAKLDLVGTGLLDGDGSLLNPKDPSLHLPLLLDDFHAREILHVTFGSALTMFGTEIKSAITKHEDAYCEALKIHFGKHLKLLEQVDK
jgi:hypothetical protein